MIPRLTIDDLGNGENEIGEDTERLLDLAYASPWDLREQIYTFLAQGFPRYDFLARRTSESEPDLYYVERHFRFEREPGMPHTPLAVRSMGLEWDDIPMQHLDTAWGTDRNLAWAIEQCNNFLAAFDDDLADVDRALALITTTTTEQP